MNTEKKLTGYPSIDKPWLKYYREEPDRTIITEQTIYQLVFSNDQDMNSVALEYLKVKWTFEKLKKETDKAAASFYSSGLRCGDVVLIGVSSCPEAIVCLLALNKIGVVSKWFDIRAGEKDIKEYANESKCKYLIAFDMLLPLIKCVIDQTNLEKVLIITPADSLSIVKQIGYSIKEKNSIPKDERFVLYRDFITNNYSQIDVECVPFNINRPSIMIQSSGTTGKPKVIVHSDYSVANMAKSLSYSDMPIGKSKKLLNLLPPWIAYSIVTAVIYPLALGCEVILSPVFDPDTLMKYIGDFTISFTAPPPYRYLYEHFDDLSSSRKKAFYDSIDGLASGGDKISIDENKRIEEKLHTILFNGYGNNEACSVLTVNPIKHNKYGSVGIPKYGDTIIAFDNENQKELKYNEIGEICALTDTMLLYYEGNEKATASIKKLHPDGQIWLHTGDLGYIDEEGFVFLKGRIRRVIARNGFKLSAYTIEEAICEHPMVKECVVVEVNDIEEEHVPMAFIVLNEDVEESEAIIRESVIKKCKQDLKENEIPKYINIVNALPYTQNGKYDFRKLEELGNKYVDSIKQ